MLTQRKEIVKDGKLLGNVELYVTLRFLREELNREMRVITVTIILLDSSLLIVLVLTLRKLIIRPLNRILTISNAIASGDFSQEIEIRQMDEIGALSNAYREMQVKVAEVVREVKTSASELMQRCQEMNSVAEQTSQGASQQAAATEEVSSSMEEMASNLRQTARTPNKPSRLL